MKLILTVVLIPVLSLGVPACDEEQAPQKEIIRPVRVVTVGATAGGRQRSFSGTAHAGIESRLSFKVAGTVKKLTVQVGDRVKKGDLIAELDASTYDLQVEQAKASQAQAQAQLRNAEAAFKRARELYANRSASKSELDAARAAAETAGAMLRSATKQVQLARQQRGYTRLKAPADGSIADCKIEVNENVSIGKTVVVLTSGQDIEVQVAVPGVIIAKVRKGNRVQVKFDALPGKILSGTVDEVGVTTVEGGAMFPVTVRLDRPDEKIRAGMAAEVTFEFGGKDAPPRIIVPAVAVGEDRKGRFVFVAKATGPGLGVVERKPVEVGELTGEGLEVTSGLTDGDVVVTAGLSFLEDGRKVRLPRSADEK